MTEDDALAARWRQATAVARTRIAALSDDDERVLIWPGVHQAGALVLEIVGRGGHIGPYVRRHAAMRRARALSADLGCKIAVAEVPAELARTTGTSFGRGRLVAPVRVFENGLAR